MNAMMNQAQGAVTREHTLAERVEKACSSLTLNCERIEASLARVNGVPSPVRSIDALAGKIAPSMSLVGGVENIEQLAQRLTDIASSVERIA